MYQVVSNTMRYESEIVTWWLWDFWNKSKTQSCSISIVKYDGIINRPWFVNLLDTDAFDYSIVSILTSIGIYTDL